MAYVAKPTISVDCTDVLKKIKNIENINLTQPLIQASEVIANKAKENAPFGEGHLRDSIHIRIEDKQGIVYVGANYGVYVEYGTGLYAKDGDGRKDVPWSYQTADGKWHSTSGQKPQPFMENTINDPITVSKAKTALLQGIIQEIRNA